MKTHDRSGFSLMEVLLATAILLGSMIVLSELAGIGRHHANSAQRLATAQLLCQNKMNELLVGMAALESVDAEPLEEVAIGEAAPAAEGLDDGLGEGLSQQADQQLVDDSSQHLDAEGKAPLVWFHSIEIESMDAFPLVSVRVTVWQGTEEDEEPRHTFSLVRWMPSPYSSEDEMGFESPFGTSPF